MAFKLPKSDEQPATIKDVKTLVRCSLQHNHTTTTSSPYIHLVVCGIALSIALIVSAMGANPANTRLMDALAIIMIVCILHILDAMSIEYTEGSGTPNRNPDDDCCWSVPYLRYDSEGR